METRLNLAQYSCIHLSGVGKKVADALEKIGIKTVQDLLFHLPIRYQDRTRLTAIRDITSQEYCVIEGFITQTKNYWQKKRMLSCELRDGTGQITCRFFHFNAKQQQAMKKGFKMRCFGEVRYYRGSYSMIHPEYQIFEADQTLAVEEYLTPIYPVTHGLGQRTIRQLIQQALYLLQTSDLLPEYLPQKILDQHQSCELKTALLYVHTPPPDAHVDSLLAFTHPMQQRLIFEELVAQQAAIRRIRYRMQEHKGPSCLQQSDLIERFIASLPFQLTAAQQRVINEIYTDLNKPVPMMRLLQGDVGSGKTIVSLLSMLKVIDNGYQAALMAPTEILAEQHYQYIKKILQPFDIHVAWLSGKLKAKDRNYALAAIHGGQAKIAIGTHALFQKKVVFAKLGFIVIDEQHRFGVDQRMSLRGKGESNESYPHQLVMTATPIPRTLAMTAYGEMDYSIIDELPPGRHPIKTTVLPNSRRDEVLARVKQQCLEGQQVYWVCTLIEESDVLQCQAAEKTASELQERLPNLKIGLIHGQVGSELKESTMRAFKEGEIDLLVATTVIEVGVDVPNANLIIIENSERFGLSQLHQLRGRVGRGSQQSFCLLLYQSPLSEQAKSRLAVMRESNNGFLIAQRDLELRGPGEVLGTRQTGIARYKVANIIRDKNMLDDAKSVCLLIEKNYPEYLPMLISRWLGDNEHYGTV